MKENLYHRNGARSSNRYVPPVEGLPLSLLRMRVDVRWWENIETKGGRRKNVCHKLGFDVTPECVVPDSCVGGIIECLSAHGILPGKAISFGEFIDKVFIPNSFPMLQGSTRSRYWRTLRTHLLPEFEGSSIASIGASKIQSFFSSKIDAGLGWEALCHIRALLAKIFECARAWGYRTGSNPVSGLTLPRKSHVRTRQVLTPKQLNGLSSQLKEPARMMVALAVGAGMRIGEMLALDWQDVDLENCEISVKRSFYRGNASGVKSKSSNRTIAVPLVLIHRLQQIAPEVKKGLVFQSSRGTPLNDTNLLHRDLKPAGEAIGVPWISWHVLRRTHATQFQAAGGALRDAQLQLGHAHPLTTLDVYTVAIDENRRRCVERLSGLVSAFCEESLRSQDLH